MSATRRGGINGGGGKRRRSRAYVAQGNRKLIKVYVAVVNVYNSSGEGTGVFIQARA